jgi:Calcineurin-like phosphoesterase
MMVVAAVTEIAREREKWSIIEQKPRFSMRGKTHGNHPHLSLTRTAAAAALSFAAVALLLTAPSPQLLLLLFPSTFGIEDNNNNNIPTTTAVSLTDGNNNGSSTTSAAANGSTGPADFNIATVGDWGCTPNTEDTVDNIISKSPEVVLGLGDNSYDDSADCWYEVVDPIIDKMITAIGNHEHERPGEEGDPAIPLPEKLNETMNRFGLSEQYYTYRYGNVFVLVMSTEIPFDEDSEQFDFVERSLSEASSDPDVDWIIVMHHRLMYTSPSATTESSGLAETYHRLFEEHDVDLVLQGHVHSYERSVPIVYKDGEADFPIPTSTNGETYVDPEGQIFATVGTGGHSIHEFQGMNYYIQKQYEGYGFLDIEIKNGEDGGGKRLVGTFYDNDGGGIQDQFTVIKQEEDDEEDSPPSDERSNNTTESD